MSASSSFKNYRAALRDAWDEPALPYFGTQLQDLVFITDGNPKLTPEVCFGCVVVAMAGWERSIYQGLATTKGDEHLILNLLCEVDWLRFVF